jgi:hypothetical protein
MWTSRLV